MFSAPIYLLLTISIVTEYADCYVVDNGASMRNEAKSRTDYIQTAYFDSNNSNSSSSSNSSNNDIILDNHIRISTINETGIDNDMEMPKPNVAADYATFRMSRDSSDISAELETGELYKN